MSKRHSEPHHVLIPPNPLPYCPPADLRPLKIDAAHCTEFELLSAPIFQGQGFSVLVMSLRAAFPAFNHYTFKKITTLGWAHSGTAIRFFIEGVPAP